MNAPVNFAFNDKLMRVVWIDLDPWWVAADLCALLGLSNVTMALKKLDEDQLTLNLIEGIGKGLPVNVVSESGMWTLVLRSDKPEAVEVRRWLTGEVLPALRKHGHYEMPGFEPPPAQALDFDPMRLSAGANVVRLGLRLFGPVAARNLWAQVGLPPVLPDSEAVFDTDPFAVPLRVYLDGRQETTIQQAADGMGLRDIDWSTRFRIGKLLKLWGWQATNRKIAKHRTGRVFMRPANGMTIEGEVQ